VIRRGIIIALLIPVLVVVAIVVAADLVAVHITDSAIAKRIEQRVPGSHASVSISSTPFLYHLAAAGNIEELHAHVTDVTEGSYTFSSIDVTIDNLKIDRGDLLSGKVHLDSITRASIIATLTQEELFQAGVLTSLKDLGVLNPSSQATVHVGTNQVTVKVAGVSIVIPFNSLVSCVATAVFQGGNLVLSCTTNTLPPALAQAAQT
jgi:hypothetical protein